MTFAVPSALLLLVAIFVSLDFVCPLHFKKYRYLSRVSGGKKCERCKDRMRLRGEPDGFHEHWIAKNWRKL